MAKSRAQQAAIAISMKKAGKKPKKHLVKAQEGKQTPFQKGVSKGDFKASDTTYVKKYIKDVVSGANKLSPDAPKTTKGKKDYNKKLADAYKKTYGHTSPMTIALDVRSTQGDYPYDEKEFRLPSQGGVAIDKGMYKESFNDAFKRARQAGYSTFKWNGKSYNTKLKDEKKLGGVPKGYHKMPSGKIMKNSAHKKTKPLAKAQKGIAVKPTADSTAYYKKEIKNLLDETGGLTPVKQRSNADTDKLFKLSSGLYRQQFKGKPGYDKNGFPIKKSTTKKKK